MLTDALRDLSKDVADKLDNIGDRERREAALLACKRAISRRGPATPEIARGLRMLESGIYGEEGAISAIQRLVEEIDMQYFAAQERYDAGQGDEATFLKLFRAARAASAVAFALDNDPLTAAVWSIYEASAALGDHEDVDALLTDLTRDGTA